MVYKANDKKTIDSILEDMETRVAENQPVSPVQWLEGAISINALKGNLDDNIADFEANLAIREAEYIEMDNSAVTAKILAKKDVDYEGYLKAKAKEKRITEFLRLAKKRSMINEFSI